MEFATYCVTEMTTSGNGFISLDGAYLLLRNVTNALVTWAVTIKQHQVKTGFPSPIAEYRRTCNLVFGKYMSLPTSFPESMEELLTKDGWPQCALPESKGLKRETHCDRGSRTKTQRQTYRFVVDDEAVQAFNERDEQQVKKYVLDTVTFGVLAWGLTEALLENTDNPFRFSPLLPFGTSLREWFQNVVKGYDWYRMASALVRHESFICGNVVHRDNVQGFVVAKRDSSSFPTVHFSDIARERPENQRRDVFLVALFFNLYAGGTMGKLKVTDSRQLLVCFSDAVRLSLVREPNQKDTLRQYKRALVEFTNGRTDLKIVNQFFSIDDLSQHLIIDHTLLKFDIPTVYTHPESGKLIKLAMQEDGKVLSRWTNGSVQPLDRNFINDRNIRQAFLRRNKKVDVVLLEILAAEAETLTLAHAALMFADVDLSLSEDIVTEEFQRNLFDFVENGQLDLEKTTTFAKQLCIEALYSTHLKVGKTGTEGAGHTVVYGDSAFLVIAANPSKEEKALMKMLNKDVHLRILSVLEPSVDDLFAVDPKLKEFLIKASKGRLVMYLQQIEAFRGDGEEILSGILRQAFVNGPWKQHTAKETLPATLISAFYTYGGDATSMEDLVNGKSDLPLYLVRNSRVCHIVHFSKKKGFIVYRIESNKLQRSNVLTRILNNNEPQGLFTEEVCRDLEFVIFLLHLAYRHRSKTVDAYKRLLTVVKKDLHRLAREYYNVEIVGATAFGVFNPIIGEEMLTDFIETELFAKTRPRSVVEKIDFIHRLEQCDKAWAVQIDDCAMFVKYGKPVLFVYNGAASCQILNEIIFEMWLGGGSVGFLLLPSALDHPFSFRLTLVFTQELLRPTLHGPLHVYGNISTILPAQTLPLLQRQLTEWAMVGTISDNEVAAVVSGHSKNVIRFSSNRDLRMFDPSFGGLTTLTNSFTQTSVINIPDRIKSEGQNKYGSLEVTLEEFKVLFATSTQ